MTAQDPRRAFCQKRLQKSLRLTLKARVKLELSQGGTEQRLFVKNVRLQAFM